MCPISKRELDNRDLKSFQKYILLEWLFPSHGHHNRVEVNSSSRSALIINIVQWSYVHETFHIVELFRNIKISLDFLILSQTGYRLSIFKHIAEAHHCCMVNLFHYGEVIIGVIASQITSLTIVYSTVYSEADQRKHQSSASLAFVRGIHRGPVNSLHKWPVMRKMFPFDDVTMPWNKTHGLTSINYAISLVAVFINSSSGLTSTVR